MRAGCRPSIRAVVAPSTPIVRFHVCFFLYREILFLFLLVILDIVLFALFEDGVPSKV